MKRSALTLSLSALGATLLGAAPAFAQASPSPCPGSLTWADVTVSGFECSVGDKVYSNFRDLTGFTEDQRNDLTLSPGNAGPTIHTLVWGFTQQNPTISNLYSFKYTISITDPDQYIQEFSTSALASSFGSGAFTKTLQALIPAAGTATGVATSANNQTTTPVGNLSPAVTSYDFLTSITVNEIEIKTYQDRVDQARIPGVPGPLPLLGAGAAFGFSRKLRRRVQAAA